MDLANRLRCSIAAALHRKYTTRRSNTQQLGLLNDRLAFPHRNPL
jgi:hypothetical protein